jgi:MHS family proline/betaine transporter-like MFS transporter
MSDNDDTTITFLKLKRNAAARARVAEISPTPPKKNPIREAITTNLRATLSVGMVGSLWSSGFYVFFVWGATYMNDILEPPIEHAFAVNACALFVGVCIFFSIGGSLSDTFGRRPLMLVGR